MKFILLGGKRGLGKSAIIDDEDYEKVSQYNWHLDSKGYPRCATKDKYQNQYQIFMHQLVMGYKFELRKGKKTRRFIDHINCNPLDNQKSNLRFCTHGQNMSNTPKSKGASKYKGVYIEKKPNGNKVNMQIGHNKKRYRITNLPNEHIAALTHDLWVIDLHGDFAKTNFEVIGHSSLPA